MTRLNRSLARTGIAGLAVGVASVIAASAAPPAGAMTAAATAPQTSAQPVHPLLDGTTPLCLVGAAMFYPMFLGGVLFRDPTALPSAAPGYWVGGQKGDQGAKPDNGNGANNGRGDANGHGWLQGCGLNVLPQS
jgi:hypothetical protein